MQSRRSQWLQIRCPVRIASATAMMLGCSSSYEPEGQFWPNLAQVGIAVDSAAKGDAGAIERTGDTDGIMEGPRDGIPLGQGSGAPATGGSATGGRAAGGSAGAGGGAASLTCALSVSVTTTAPGGNYKPRNVGAIWIADSTGRFVKSLDVWGNRRLSHVTAWNAATRAAGAAGNKVDAVTSATLSAHRAHNVSWNCRDYNQQVVSDGTYRVYFEVTDSNNAGPNHFETFTKGPMAATVQGSATNFTGIVLTFKP